MTDDMIWLINIPEVRRPLGGEGSDLTWPPTSCRRAVLTGSCSMSVLMAVWSNGQALRCSLFRHILQTVCPQPRLMGRRTVSSNVCVQIGHSRNSVHCGACTGMIFMLMGHVGVWVGVCVNVRFDTDKTNNIYLYMEDSTGIKNSFFRTQSFLYVLTHCGFGNHITWWMLKNKRGKRELYQDRWDFHQKCDLNTKKVHQRWQYSTFRGFYPTNPLLFFLSSTDPREDTSGKSTQRKGKCRERRLKTTDVWPTLKCRLTLRLRTKGPEEATSQVHLRYPTWHKANAC